MKYPQLMENDGPANLEIAMGIAVLVVVFYGAYKVITYSPVAIASAQAVTETVAGGSLGVSAIAGMLK